MGNSKRLANVIGMKFHFTYQTKNLVNGKTYIGRHSTNNLNDGYLGSGKLLRRAFKKYGKENFILIPLDYFDSFEEVVAEEEWIVDKEYCLREDNYNMVPGGRNPIMYGENNPEWKGGSKYIRKGRTPKFGKDNPSFGRVVSELQKEQAYKTKMENGILAGLIADGVKYTSVAECAKFHGIDESTVNSRCVSIHFSGWNYECVDRQSKSTAKYKEKVNKRYEKKRKETENKKKFFINIEGYLFTSFAEVSKKYNLHRDSIQNRCVSVNFPEWSFINYEDFLNYKEIVDKRNARNNEYKRNKYKSCQKSP